MKLLQKFVKRNGFTLVETIVVVAIMAIAMLASFESVVSFQKTSVLDNAAREMASTIRRAQNKSMSSELLTGTVETSYMVAGLPSYGLGISGSTYTLISQYQLTADASLAIHTLETYPLDTTISVTPGTLQLLFTRHSGISGATTITLQKSGVGTRVIHVNDQGSISVTKS